MAFRSRGRGNGARMSMGAERTRAVTAQAHPAHQPADGAIRIARYTGYPRVSKNQRECTAIARTTASSTLELIAVDPEAVGALLRLKVNDFHRSHARETLARVVSCSARDDGRFDVLVEPVEPNRPRFVRRASEVLRLEG